jgi:hypothetical protein
MPADYPGHFYKASKTVCEKSFEFRVSKGGRRCSKARLIGYFIGKSTQILTNFVWLSKKELGRRGSALRRKSAFKKFAMEGEHRK